MPRNYFPTWSPWIFVVIQSLLLMIFQLDSFQRTRSTFDPKTISIIKHQEAVETGMPEEENNLPQEKSFHEVAKESGAFKPDTFSLAYEKYLTKLRQSPVRLLEIGLGCGTKVGPGKSLQLWDQYFTHHDTQIFFIEYNAECAKEWQGTHDRVIVESGDQSNVHFLRSFLKKHGSSFDVIVDDGGLTMVQQITSLIHLFPSLRSGGLYLLEDLHTSYLKQYGGEYLNNKTTMEYIKNMLDGFYQRGPANEIINLVRNIDCYHQICVFVKK